MVSAPPTSLSASSPSPCPAPRYPAMASRARQVVHAPLAGAAASSTTQWLSMTYPKSAGAPVSMASAFMLPMSPSPLGYSHTCQPSSRRSREVRPSLTARRASVSASGRSLLPTDQ